MYSNGQNVTAAAPANDPHQQYVVQHRFDGPAELTTTLVHAVADVTGADPTDVEFAVANYVDPDALNRLFKPKPDGTVRAHGEYRFTVWNYHVTVSSDGRIAVVPSAPHDAHRSATQ